MKNKILTILSIVIFTICALAINVYAAITSATFKLTPSKSTYNVGDEVIITIRLDSIVADRGIISYGATLEYDKDVLSYVSCSGAQNWTAPFYNDENGKLIADRNIDFSGLEGEDLCTFKFTAKKEMENATIKLSNIQLSNGGSNPGNASNAQTTFSIKSTTSNPPDTSDENETDDNTTSGDENVVDPDNNTSSGDSNTTTDEGDGNNTTTNTTPSGSGNNDNNNNNNNSKPNNNNKENADLSDTPITRFPNLGANDYLYVSILVIALLIIVWYKKLKSVNKKIKKQVNYIVADEMKKELDKK